MSHLLYFQTLKLHPSCSPLHSLPDFPRSLRTQVFLEASVAALQPLQHNQRIHPSVFRLMGAGASATFKESVDSISEADLADALSQLTTEEIAVRFAAIAEKERPPTQEEKASTEARVDLSQVVSGLVIAHWESPGVELLPVPRFPSKERSAVESALQVLNGHASQAATRFPEEWARAANLQQRFPQKKNEKIEVALKVRDVSARVSGEVAVRRVRGRETPDLACILAPRTWGSARVRLTQEAMGHTGAGTGPGPGTGAAAYKLAPFGRQQSPMAAKTPPQPDRHEDKSLSWLPRPSIGYRYLSIRLESRRFAVLCAHVRTVQVSQT